jgi:broad specificity phosphatase PhoE
MMSDFSGVSNVSLGESAYEVAQGKLGLETGRSVSYSDRLVGGEFSAYRQNSASKDWEWGFSGRNKNGKQYHATGTVKFSGVFGAEQLREGSLVKKQILEAKRQSEGGVGAVPGFEIRYSDQEVFKAGTQPSLSHRVGVWLENQGAQAVQHRLGGKTLTISNDEQGGRLWAAAEASGQLGLKGGPLALPAGASARFKGGYDKQKKALEGSAMAERGLAALGVVSEILNALAMTPKRSANRTAIRPPRVVGRTGVGTNAPPTRVVKGVVPQMPGGQMITPHEQIVLRTPAKMLGQKKVKKSVPVLGAQQVITARLQEQLSRLGIKCDDPQQVKLGREIYVIGTEKQTKKTFQVKVNADGSLNRQSATTAGSRQISSVPPDDFGTLGSQLASSGVKTNKVSLRIVKGNLYAHGVDNLGRTFQIRVKTNGSLSTSQLNEFKRQSGKLPTSNDELSVALRNAGNVKKTNVSVAAGVDFVNPGEFKLKSLSDLAKKHGVPEGEIRILGQMRHGQSTANVAGADGVRRYGGNQLGTYDSTGKFVVSNQQIDLTATGRGQASEAAPLIRQLHEQYGIHTAIISPAPRSQQTHEPWAVGLKIDKVFSDPRSIEKGFGTYVGTPHQKSPDGGPAQLPTPSRARPGQATDRGFDTWATFAHRTNQSFKDTYLPALASGADGKVMTMATTHQYTVAYMLNHIASSAGIKINPIEIGKGIPNAQPVVSVFRVYKDGNGIEQYRLLELGYFKGNR